VADIAREPGDEIVDREIGVGRETPVNDIEIAGVQAPARSLPGTRLNAFVTIRQHGFAGGAATLSVRDGDKIVASRQIRLDADGKPAAVPGAGAQPAR
jgi:hypothetical protein